MKSIEANGYSIFFNEIGYQKINEIILKNKYSSLFILVDEHTNNYCLPEFLPNLAVEIPIEIIEIEAGEGIKNIATCLEIWSILSDLGADRKSAIINLGGGVITDIGGFIASTFKRGIDFINVPTTLLGMVDASIGGKNGVDLGNLKNQIGVINVPQILLIDTSFLETLSQREMRSGLAEMLKHGLIYDKNYWEQFLILSEIDFADFDDLIYRSIEIKNEIVKQDPTENGIRKALNFGHTLGHAIESHFLESAAPLLHGEAIAIGMILESYISKEKGLLSNEEFHQIKYTLTDIYEKHVFAEKDIDSILKLLIHDKKNEYGKVQFALINGIGKIILNQSVENEIIIKSFDDYKT
ncbi:3-dehydroquinate synthase [Flavobacterium sp. SUN052]|uniref:3-dehydroquinate synthase n=1 Tax=Flavobacterium sp. SUN052 TaxID=3002441 RepID=UPI00237EB0B0|nr:3-dehydroquinate synthase [Flavobacterium sp. SUN052]MEC4005190.1 3-dehydroquinate synthase [Flavobacterium sp. SUN052]